jgi:hypothetical protein
MSFPTETGQVEPDMFRSASEANGLMRGRTFSLRAPVTILWTGVKEESMNQPFPGTCVSCNKEFARNAITKHIAACEQRKSGDETRFHIVVQGSYLSQYWLHVAAHPKARLSDLDAFLRNIWLECCGHLSSFDIGGREYLSARIEDSDAESMAAALGRVLTPGLKFRHTYDFGTSTELSLRVVGEIRVASGKGKIRLLARNIAPVFECGECERPATQICSQCMWDGDAWFCDPCALEHECGEEMLLPAVNSPRVGQCGYTG